MTQTNDVLEQVGQKLKKAIANSKFKTQERFASEGMNRDGATIRRWIRHGVNCVSTIVEIADALEIDFHELL